MTPRWPEPILIGLAAVAYTVQPPDSRYLIGALVLTAWTHAAVRHHRHTHQRQWTT